MGGPVSKAAYVTGTALLASGNFTFMAGVSAACITPPLVTGFAYGFWKNRTTDNTEVENIIDDNIDAMGPTSITTS